MGRKAFCPCPFHSLIPLSTLVQDDIDDFVLVAYIFRWKGHDSVEDVAEEFYIAVGILLNP
jgi:hypothetical protein